MCNKIHLLWKVGAVETHWRHMLHSIRLPIQFYVSRYARHTFAPSAKWVPTWAVGGAAAQTPMFRFNRALTNRENTCIVFSQFVGVIEFQSRTVGLLTHCDAREIIGIFRIIVMCFHQIEARLIQIQWVASLWWKYESLRKCMKRERKSTQMKYD